MEPGPTSRRFELRQLLDSYVGEAAESRFWDEMRDLARSPHDVLSAYWYTPGHFTASAFVVDDGREQLLLVHHRKLDAWLQPGGHIDPGDGSMMAAAQREVIEETGVSQLQPLVDGLFDIDVHRIPAHGGTPPHLHHDLRFLFVASDDSLAVSTEVKDAQWVALADVGGFSTDRSVVRVAAKIAGLLGSEDDQRR